MQANMRTTLDEQLLMLRPLLAGIRKAASLQEKVDLLDSYAVVKEFYADSKPFINLPSLTPKAHLVMKSVVAIGQKSIFSYSGEISSFQSCFENMMEALLEVEEFYRNIGGIVGYHVKVLELMNNTQENRAQTTEQFIKTPGLNLSGDAKKAMAFAVQGILNLPALGEIYPIGGAGDRLGLVDEGTGEALPAALLMFCGRTLIEGLIRDLQAKEFLYYKVFGIQLQTPIALMTSREKNNHQHLLEIFEKKHWFGRPQESYFIFDQPLVPLIDVEGNWVRKDIFDLALKPGGHGVIWKLAKERGVFQWFFRQNRDRVLVRQINNPIAGLDVGILAFTGKGCENKKAFGFLSCPRQVKSAEGVLVTVLRKLPAGFEYCVSNLEYTSFPLHGIEDLPETEKGTYSIYPSNTNILFADLKKIEEIVERCPIPGLLVNVKTEVHGLDGKGQAKTTKAGRLESTMQNISDHLLTQSKQRLNEIDLEKDLKTYVVYNERKKTISVTKNSYVPGKSIHETPEGAFYDLMINMRDLLVNHCRFQIPPEETSEDFVTKGPELICFIHPALGPFFHIIGQKIRGGRLAQGSEMQLEITELDIENLELDGSLIIEAECIMGKVNENEILDFGPNNGKCTLKNVKILNQGRKKRPDQFFWKNQISRHECLKIVLKGNSEFYAEDITIIGSHLLEVPDGHKMIAHERNGELVFDLEKIDGPTWKWNYVLSDSNNIHLQKIDVKNVVD